MVYPADSSRLCAYRSGCVGTNPNDAFRHARTARRTPPRQRWFVRT